MTQSSKKIMEITAYQTTDGQVHTSKALAESHQEQIDDTEYMTNLLHEGFSIGEILACCGSKDIPQVLFSVTKESQLVISYLQCRETPGYKPIRFENPGVVQVFGDAGSWMGAYGSSERISDIVRFAQDERSLL